MGITNDGEASVTRVVGTYGYVAPEWVNIVTLYYNSEYEIVSSYYICLAICRYLRDGLATTKSDVYAFGVVLFEIISGKEAVTRTEGGTAVKNAERRSLVSIVSLAIWTE